MKQNVVSLVVKGKRGAWEREAAGGHPPAEPSLPECMWEPRHCALPDSQPPVRAHPVLWYSVTGCSLPLWRDVCCAVTASRVCCPHAATQHSPEPGTQTCLGPHAACPACDPNAQTISLPVLSHCMKGSGQDVTIMSFTLGFPPGFRTALPRTSTPVFSMKTLSGCRVLVTIDTVQSF